MSEFPVAASSAGAGRARRAPDADWRRAFVEEFGELDLVPGTPRASMRVLGFMVVCQPPVQSAQQIMEALTLSAGSVSTAVNTLQDNGLLERVTRAGDRHLYYRLSAQGWERVLRARFCALGEVRRAADLALQAAQGEADHRLCDLRHTFACAEAGMAQLLGGGRREWAEDTLAARGATPIRRDVHDDLRQTRQTRLV